MKPVNLNDTAEPVFSYDEYVAYLNSKAWDELRTRRLIFDDFQCRICGSRSNLQVHHLCYPAHGNFGTEPIHDLITLCKNCHSDIDNLRKGQTITKHKVISYAKCWIRFKDEATYKELEPKIKQWLSDNDSRTGIEAVLYIEDIDAQFSSGCCIPLISFLKLRSDIGEDRVALSINKTIGGY